MNCTRQCDSLIPLIGGINHILVSLLKILVWRFTVVLDCLLVGSE